MIRENYNQKLLEEFVNSAYKLGLKEIAFTDHDEYLKNLNWDLIEKVSKNSPIKVLKALEFDYIPGREEAIRRNIKKYKLDFAIGSIHFIDGWGFDNPKYIEEYSKRDIDLSYKNYFQLVLKAIRSNLFDIIGHFDLIKLFAFRPNQDNKDNLDSFVKDILRELKQNSLVLELNTNGINKPIKEIYPSEEIIRMAYDLNIPFTLASDAHHPKRVGENIKASAELLKKIGYKEIAVFEDRKMSFQEL